MKTANRNQRGSCILGIVIVAIGIGVIAYMLTKDTMLQRGDTRHLTFSVDASGGSAKITLSDSVGAQSFSGVTSTPWTRTATYQMGTQVYLTAGNTSGYGSIKCSIIIDGREWKNETTSGDKVGCAGIIP
jgi:hypothetical protein